MLKHITDSSADLEYACPIHPDVRKLEPGNCQICGMPLELVTHGEAPEEIVERS